MFRYWKTLVIALVLASGITYAAEIGEKAPNFTLLNLSQKKVSFSDYRGKVIILDFWATRCPPCIREIPHFVELQKEWVDKGVQIIGISLDRQGLNILKPFAKKYKINYPILLCNEITLKNYSPIKFIPTTFVIDKESKIYKKYIGYRAKEIFEKDIKELLRLK